MASLEENGVEQGAKDDEEVAETETPTEQSMLRNLIGYFYPPTAYRHFFRRGTKTPAADVPDGEKSPKRIKTHHNSENKTNVFVTPERPSKQQSEEEEAQAKTDTETQAIAEEKAEAKGREIAEAKEKAAAEARAKLKILAEFDFVEFQPVGKKLLERGKLSQRIDGLYDRQQCIDQFYRALEKLAGSMKLKLPQPPEEDFGSRETDETEYHSTDGLETMGTTDNSSASSSPTMDQSRSHQFDKTIAPFIGVTGKMKSGKTEFLRWIFNNCCTFQGEKKSPHSKALLQRLNQALPEDEAPFQNLLVLYASYNGTSAYSTNEGPICGTTVERLLRSFHGRIHFRDDYPANKRVRYEGFGKGQSIIDVFTKTYGKTGFVFLLDDLSEIQEENESEYEELLDSILEFSQACLDHGTLCAVVGSTVSPFDVCDTVINHCKKVVEPIWFPKEMPELEAKTRELLLDEFHNDLHDEDHRGLSLSVTMKVLQSMCSPRAFEEYVSDTEARGRIEPLVPKPFRLPASVSSEYVFSLAARALFNEDSIDIEPIYRKNAENVVNHLSGHLILDTDSDGQITEWSNDDKDWIQQGELFLPVWRLFQFQTTFHKQLFPQVQNWVWVETRKLFYEYGPTEATKTLETSTMALLELRKAVLQSNRKKPPSLEELFRGIRMQHNLSESMLTNTRASKSSTKLQCFGALPYSFEIVQEPTIYLSSCASNQKGIEGVLKDCFDGVTIFFQTKIYAAGGSDELCDWLVNAHKRAHDLGYREGEYIVQLFCPGDGGTDDGENSRSSDNVSDTSDATNHQSKWPANSMVFSDQALMDIFEPFLKLTLY